MISIYSGAEIYDTAGLCPPFSPSNSNAFGSTFGIEFKDKDGQLYIRPFSAYEVTCCFKLDRNLTHSLSHASNFSLLECGIPHHTSQLLFVTLLKDLLKIRDESFEIIEPNRIAAPAALAQVPIFTNGAIGSRIPDKDIWSKALREDPMTKMLLDIVSNPSMATKENLLVLHHMLCSFVI